MSYRLPLFVLLGLIALALAASGCSQPTSAQEPTVEIMDEISVEQAYQKYEQGVFFLDVRTQEEWEEFHAPNSTHIPLDELEERVGELAKDQEIVVVCRSGNRSQDGRDILREAGFEPVSSMAGGLRDWKAAGYPTVSGP
jgi:rhodanese-related sulfurtransferase